MTARTARRPSVRRFRPAAAGAVVLTGALVLTLSGCGDQTDAAQQRRAAGGQEAPLADKLPKKIRDAGVLKVGSDAAYRPMEYKKGAEIVGLDPDIADAMGKKLGVRFEFTNGTFDGLITSLRTGRFDMIMSAMTDTRERQEGLDDNGEKAGSGVDFVDYLSAGSSILVNKGNPEKIEKVGQMCGRKIATQRGTTSHEILKKQAKKCLSDGEKKLSVEAYDTDDEARVRLKAGGVDADVSDFPVAANAAAATDDFEVVGEQMQSAPYGMAVSKSNTELRSALKAALESVVKDGTYMKALKKWGVEDGAVSEVEINGGS